MAKMIGEAINPVSEDDPRFDPESLEESAEAFGLDPDPVDEESVDAEEVQSLIKSALERAIDHYEENLEPDQALATDYYYGRPFGDEQDGRSKVVSTDVRDATHAQMPSLLRIFFSPERAVEFGPVGPEDEPVAEQQTDYINHIVAQDNKGILIFDSWFKDALIRRTGWVKWWLDEKHRVEASNYTGLGVEEVSVLASDPTTQRFEILQVVQSPTGEETFDVRVTRQETVPIPRYDCIPPEEIVYTPNARSLDDAALLAHVREVPKEDLIVLGIDEELIEDAMGKKRSSGDDLEDARQFHGMGAWDDDDSDLDESQKKCVFAEVYALIDADGDGVAELRLFQCVGPDFEIANGDGLGEIVDEVPFAVLTPHPEPHTIVGLSNWDLLKDVQRVNSQLERGMLDSLAKAIDPDTEVVDGAVNMSDLLGGEGIVRVRAIGQMREVAHTFVGAQVLPVLDYQNQKKENRTGQTRAAQGLDADSLQSSTKAAVAATLSAGQQRIEYIARIFAETGVRRLYAGLLRLVCKHQNRERMVRMRGKWVSVDPRHWNAERDVTVNVGLGQGTPEDRIQALAGIISLQRELMQAGAPLVSYVEIRNTLAKAVELAGFRNPEMFFKPFGPKEAQAMAEQMAQQPPPPDPNMMLVQIEAQRLQLESQEKAARLELDREKLRMEDDREREKIARDFTAKMEEIKAKRDIEDTKVAAQVERDRRAMDDNNTKEAA